MLLLFWFEDNIEHFGRSYIKSYNFWTNQSILQNIHEISTCFKCHKPKRSIVKFIMQNHPISFKSTVGTIYIKIKLI